MTTVADLFIFDAAEPVELSDRGVAQPTSWVKIFPHGVFKHPDYGVLRFDDRFLAQVKANFDQNVRGIDISFDFKHENGEAAGWIEELDHRQGDGIYARTAWTPLGIQNLRDKIYKYVSPQFGTHIDELTERKFPNTLIAVALTNVPFLKRLPAVEVALSECELMDVVELADGEQPAKADAKPAPKQGATGKQGAGDEPLCKNCREPIKGCTCGTYATNTNEQSGDTESGSSSRVVERETITREKIVESEQEAHGTNASAGASSTPTPPAEPGDVAKSDGKGGTPKKNTTQEGAPQPGKMRGAKPHITRNRQSDPGNEVDNAMSEANKETVAGEQVAVNLDEVTRKLAEYEQVTKRLEERAAKAEADALALAEKVALAERAALERDVTDETRSLSERGSVTVTTDDGEMTKALNHGLPRSAVEMYRAFALKNPALRTEVFAILQSVQETGTVALEEKGVSTIVEERDPHKLTETPSGVIGGDVVKAAQEYAQTNGLNWASLADQERAFIAVADKSGYGK